MKKILQLQWIIAMALVMSQTISCKKDPVAEVIAGFTFQVDASDFKKVKFTNASQNFTKLSWDFGDGSAVSSEENPVHTYTALGNFTVKLTATGSDGTTDVSTQTVAISDPDAELTKLVGDVSKTWKLLRVTSQGRWPLEVGPISKDQVWWAMGLGNDEIVKRPCIMNDEFTFGRDGSYKYDSNGDFWAEGGVFEPANECRASTPDNMKGPNGDDFSAFGDGTHTFTLNNGAKPTLTVTGLGAFIGLCKIGTDREAKEPQPSVTLDIVKLSDGAVDTLILESDWKFPDNMGNNDDAYWKIVLVHYDNPADEPPVAGFEAAVAGSVVAFNNISYDATSYNWNFGDGSSSSEANPSHTYANAGIYTVVLTATRGNATSTAQLDVTISANITEAELIGAPWKVRPEANSIFVGPALGSNAWWGVPANFLDGTTTGTDDWSCITNDEFIFSAGGVYEYKTNGDARNDGYMSVMGTPPNGCISDAQVAASGNGAAFGSAIHSFTLTPGTGSSRPIITLTNGPTGAAFVGFYKGYFGGENKNNEDPPNGGSLTNRYEVMSYVNDGTTETLTLSVDISGAKDGSSAWTVVLQR